MSVLRTLARSRYLVSRIFPLMRHPSVPWALKAGTILGAVLIISPLDLFGDIPILGWMDDAALLAVLAMLFVKTATWLVVRETVANEPRRVTPTHPALTA